MKQLLLRRTQSGSLLGLGLLLGFCLPTRALGQGSIEAWGDDVYGQVSDTGSGLSFSYVAAGDNFSVAIRSDGSMVAWGRDQYGQVSNLPSGTDFTQVAAGSFGGIALRTDGSLISWGDDGVGQVSNIPGGTGFTQVAAGAHHSVALRADGSIASWGSDYQGQVSSTPSGTGYLHVAAGLSRSLAVRADGTLEAWGQPFAGTPTGSGFTRVATRTLQSVALRADGSIVSWGSNIAGLISDTPSGTGFVQIATGWMYSLALHSDGSIHAWGAGIYGQVTDSPEGNGLTMLAASVSHGLALGLNDPGSSFCFGDGTGAACPCSGHGDPGSGCENFGGLGGAKLVGFGETSLSDDSFRMVVGSVPSNRTGLVFRGTNAVNGGLGIPFGDGLRCVGGQVARSQVQVTDGLGTVFRDIRGMPFSTWNNGIGGPTHYQFWYRDPGNPCSGSGFNLSNAWSVTWTL